MASACSASGVPPTATTEAVPAPSATSSAAASTQPAPTATSDGFSTCWESEPSAGAESGFLDATAQFGLVAPLAGMHAHAAAFADVNADGFVDLFAGTFANRSFDKYAVRGADGPAPDRILLGSSDSFERGSLPEQFGRTSGAAFADLDGDGDLDLVASRNYRAAERGDLATLLYENDGDGRFTAVAGSGLPVEFGGRSVGVLDFDGDGRLDLYMVEDRFTGGSSRLFRNEGALRFSDATSPAGLPLDVHGLGVAVGDVNNDGWSDIFVGGSNRLFLSDAASGFTEKDGPFEWEPLGPEDDVAGAAFGDVDGDGWMDLVVGHHFNSTVARDAEVPIRLYRNRGGGEFEDITESAGLVPLPTKAPHVEFVDLDNDGWLDILTSASAAGGSLPAVFMNLGEVPPKFAAPEGLGDDQYWVTAPTADVDRDGRRDVLLVEWEPTLPSLLMLNRHDSGNWLDVVAAPGTRVELYPQGSLGAPDELLAAADITVSQGYASGQAPVAHFGLGSVETVSVRIGNVSGMSSELETVAANRRISVEGGC